MQSYSGGCSVAQCMAQCSPLPSSLHHPEHEHFFNHSRESEVEPSRGRVSHCSVCSHHAFPSPLDITMPHISMSPALQASTSLPFSHSAHLFPPKLSFSTLSFSSLSTLPCLKYYFYLCHNVISFVPFIASQPPLPPPPSPRTGWVDFLFTMGLLILPY